MRNRLLEYVARMDRILEERNQEGVSTKGLIEEHLQQIAFFQHERLVHLIVTLAVALLMMMGIGIAFISQVWAILPAVALMGVLLMFYIIHYYLLENGVQKMYRQYDALMEWSRDKGDGQNNAR